MIIVKAIVAILNIFFFTTLFAFLLTLNDSETKNNPISVVFFSLLMIDFAANTVLIIAL